MDVSTKYNIGDVVYFMRNNKVNHDYITDIDINIRYDRHVGIDKHNVMVYYYVDNHKFVEKDIFLTKEELINSL